MRVFRHAAFALLAAIAAPASAFAESAPVCKGRDLSADPAVKPDYAAFADDLVNGQGLLWKIEKPGLAPSWLYGTIHSTQPDVVAMAREAARHIDEAKSVATELGGPFETKDKVAMSSAMLSASLSPEVDTFAGELEGDRAAMAETYVAARGFPREMAHHLKLWFLAIATSLPGCETEGERRALPEVDETIAEIGKARGLEVVALETLDEQLDALKSTPAPLAAQILVATARSPELDDDAYVTLLSLYRQKHPSRAIALLDAIPGLPEADRVAERDFTKLLLVGRNGVMAERAAPLVAAGGAFIAVGALHLSGKGASSSGSARWATRSARSCENPLSAKTFCRCDA